MQAGRGESGRSGSGQPAGRPPGTFDWPLRLSPNRLLLVVTALVFLGEAVVMRVLHHLPPLPAWGLALLDAASLLIILSPTFFFLFLPLKRYYAKHQQADREIAFLSRQMIRVAEEERKRLANDLHDECGQTLTALQFGIETLRSSLPGSASVPAQQCNQLVDLTSRLSDHVRRLTAQLLPAVLENSGIGETSRWHVQQLRRQRPDLQVDLWIAEEEARPSSEVETTLYRILQEGVNNVLEHARASQVKIRLRCGDTCELTIEDDGIGFDPGEVWTGDSPRGLGLLGMRERVASHHGRFTIDSAPGQGTVLRALLPAFPEVKI